MSKLDKLWDYQLKELEREQLETALKNSPVRQHLLKIKNFLLKQQNDLKKFEEIASLKNQRIAELDREYEEADGRLEELEAEMGNASDVQEIKKLRTNAENIQGDLIKLRRELMDIIGEIEKIEYNIRVMAGKVMKARTEYAGYKEKYDQEKKDVSGDLTRLKLEAEEMAKGIDAALLERYNNLKKSKADPMALIVDSKCDGCNMELPSLMLHRLKSGEETIECENCGRILHTEES